MIEIKETFNNGIEECYILTSNANKKIIEKTNNVEYNDDICIVARRLNDYKESENDREVEEIPDEEKKLLEEQEIQNKRKDK